MTTFNERDYFTGTAEYDRHFWNVMKGGKDVTDTLSSGSARESGGFYLPSGAEDKYSKAIRKESIFRNLATVIHAYGGSSRIFAKRGYRRAAPFRSLTLSTISPATRSICTSWLFS